ncbi:hypothetical protein ACFL4N_00945 [Thermodesulfobacteriota bacterium]
MVSRKIGTGTLILSVMVSAVFFLSEGPAIGGPYKSYPTKKEQKPGITQIQIQSEIMGFAETFASTIIQSFDDFAALTGKEQKHAYVTAYGDAVSSAASALTLAAEPNPSVAVLDLVVMTTLGQMIWEEHWLPRFGESAEEMVSGFKKLEKEIWAIAAKVITREEKEELRDMIVEWRREHPKQLAFSHIRFNDFAEWRKKFTLAKGGKHSGMFKSVGEAAQAADEMRLLGERALFLGTRMPLLTGDFASLWVSRILYNPEVQRIMDNMDKVSDSATMLSEEIKQLPDRFALERDATIDKTMARVTSLRENLTEDIMARVTLERTAAIDQLMDRVAGERQALLSDLTSQDGKEGLVPELRLALVQGNEMSAHIKETMEIINTLSQDDGDSAPFDIKDYTAALIQASETTREMTMLVKTVNDLFTPLPGGEPPLLRLLNSLDRVEKEGEQFIDHTFYRGLILILVTLFGFFLLLILYRYTSVRILERQK